MEFVGIRQESRYVTTKHYVVEFLVCIWSLASIALGTLLITAFITIVAIKRFHRIKKRPDCEDPGVNTALTLSDILEATNNFCKTKIVGDGGFGTVYKAQLPNGTIAAVKRLNQSKSQGQREFFAEMETFGKVRHRNLVSLLGYCSYGEEKLLLYDYMANGSLDHCTDLAGTFGYIPPEYGQSWRSTTKGDVYSFGVILLELVTGKEPTGLEFKDV
ncbi:leucine-rich repeat receptor protein kinase EMS1 [Tanacetum coccineum]